MIKAKGFFHIGMPQLIWLRKVTSSLMLCDTSSRSSPPTGAYPLHRHYMPPAWRHAAPGRTPPHWTRSARRYGSAYSLSGRLFSAIPQSKTVVMGSSILLRCIWFPVLFGCILTCRKRDGKNACCYWRQLAVLPEHIWSEIILMETIGVLWN